MLITDKNEICQYTDEHRVWQGIPGIVHTKGGRTFVSLYSGDVKETYGNFAVLLMSNDEKNFEHVAVVKKEGQYRVFDPVLWIDPLGRLWFIWNVMPGEQVMASVCDDPDADVLQWSEPRQIGRGIMMNKPVVLSTGEWMFPIAIWLKDIYPEFRKGGLCEEDVAGSYVYKTSDCGKTFQRLGMANIRKRSFDEHMVYEQRNGVLKMLVRTTYGIGAAYSYDRGKNWSNGENSGLGGPCSRFFIYRLRSGRLLLINHHNFKGRLPSCLRMTERPGLIACCWMKEIRCPIRMRWRQTTASFTLPMTVSVAASRTAWLRSTLMLVRFLPARSRKRIS